MDDPIVGPQSEDETDIRVLPAARAFVLAADLLLRHGVPTSQEIGYMSLV